jgi:hypothetical protein
VEVSTLILDTNEADPIRRARHLRRGLRDVRDRAARTDNRWRAVAFAGMIDDDAARLLVVHANLHPASMEGALRRRWPEARTLAGMVPEWPGSIRLNASTLVALAAGRRGVEPLRIVVAAQRARPMPVVGHGTGALSAEPMPITF